ARNLVAVDRERESPILSFDAVVVPFAFALAVIFVRQTASPAVWVRSIWNTGRAPDAEKIALARRRDLALLVLVSQVHEYLDLDATRVTCAHRGNRIGPDEEAAVADGTRLVRDVHPVELGDEVLVLLGRPQITRWFAGRDDHVVLDEERRLRRVDVLPAGQVLAIEHRHEAVLVRLAGEGGGEGDEHNYSGDEAHDNLRVNSFLGDGLIQVQQHASNHGEGGSIRSADALRQLRGFIACCQLVGVHFALRDSGALVG